MTATPNTFAVRTVLPDVRTDRPRPAPRQNRLFEAFEMFSLCHRIALQTEAGRTPPRWILDELGARPRD